MYERFTDRARKVMQLANQEAQRFNHEYIGTEHILLGLVREGSGVAANVLKNLDIDLLKVRQEVEKIVQCGPDMVTMGKLPQTPRAKKVVEYAIEEAKTFGHNHVGTEHLLLGILREAEGMGAQVLLNLGLRLEDVRQEVLTLLGTNTRELPDFLKPPSKTPAIDSLSRDLTALAARGQLDPRPAHDADVDHVLHVLSCRTWNRLLLVGESVFSTLGIVETVAGLLASGRVPPLSKRRLLALHPCTLLGGKSSQRRARLLCLFGEARRAENVILYLDDLHVLASAESEVGVMGVLQATLLVGYRSPLLAATTADGYRQLQESHPGLLSLFDTLLVQPQSREQTMEILRGLRERYETHHRVRIDDVALAAVVEAAETLPATRPLADRASLLLDRACARLRLREPGWQDLSLLDETIERFNQQKEEAVANQDFDTAARLRHEVEQLKQKREGACAEMTLPLDPGVIREVACAMSNRRSEL